MKPKNLISLETAKILLKVINQLKPKHISGLGVVISEAIEMTKTKS